jgi:hypothetical protein
MARQRASEVERTAASPEAPAAVGARPMHASVRTAPGPGRVADLARSLTEGPPLSNGGVARMLMREVGAYWAEVADEPLQTSEAPPSVEPAQTEPEDEAAALRRTFRSEIVKTLERFAGASAVEGTPAFDQFLTPATVRQERAASVGWTSCITTLTKIFNDAADVINKKLGVQVKTTKKGFLIRSMYGAVKFAANAEAEKHARAVGAWTTWPGTDEPIADKKDKAHPQAGDIVVLHKHNGAFGHVGFFHSWGTKDGMEIWTTIDGGQGAKGDWKDGKYVEGSGKQEIKRRNRQFWPADGKIEGEPGQGATLKVRGWVNVETLVRAAAEAP